MRAVSILAVTLLATPVLAQDDYAWPTPEISSDFSQLPEPVRAKRQALIEAARSGDIDSLRAIMDAQKTPPRVSFGDPEDAIAYLKGASEDDEGRQILGLLVDILDQPFAYYPDSEGETNYIWPYLSELDPTALTPEQTVDAYRLLNTEQLQELRDLEAWYFWRLYINESGEWTAFVAGD
ncbi:MAG: hypothetical protein ABW043_06645 [Devosia sp.]|uniref:hypothetical protein n=1 Tax=Devosia sp. TaxID=1871048 RepID=UPI003393F0EE